MKQYILRRFLAMIPTMLLASIIVFATVRLIPGSVIDLMLSQNDVSATRLSREQLLQELGLHRSVWDQYLRWVGGIILHGDWGRSLWQGTPVLDQLLERMPITIELGLIALVCAVLMAIPIGVYAAIRQDTVADYIARSFFLLMLAVPSFWIATMVMVFPSIWWGWSPEVKFVPFMQDPLNSVRQLLLPGFILGLALAGGMMRMTRTMMLEVLRQDYIRTAWAKGLGELSVIFRHALKNALIPVVTLIGLQAPVLIGGAVILEQIFVIPGMGLLLLDAVNQRDYPVISGVFLVVGLSIMKINLAVDLSYSVLDPRVRQQ